MGVQSQYDRNSGISEELNNLIKSSQNNIIGKLNSGTSQSDISKIYANGINAAVDALNRLPSGQIVAKNAPINSNIGLTKVISLLLLSLRIPLSV